MVWHKQSSILNIYQLHKREVRSITKQYSLNRANLDVWKLTITRGEKGTIYSVARINMTKKASAPNRLHPLITLREI